MFVVLICAQEEAEFQMCERYNGVCAEHLHQIISSAMLAANGSQADAVYIPSGLPDHEGRAEDVLRALVSLNLSPSCEAELASFLCLSLSGVCADSGDLVRPSLDQCEAIKTGVCAAEWEEANSTDSGQFSIEDLLVCEPPPDPVCSSGFYVSDDGLCIAECGEWRRYSDTTYVVVVFLDILSVVAFFMGTSISLLLTAIQYKTM